MTVAIRRLCARVRDSLILGVVAAFAVVLGALSVFPGVAKAMPISIDIQLNINVPNMVRISRLDDVTLGPWAGANMTSFEEFCVFSTTRSYRVTATSANGVGNRFFMNGTSNTLRYLVRWYDTNNAQQNLRNGQQSNTFAALTNNPGCSGSTNTRVRIRVRNNWAAAAPAGAYSDTLTLLIEPQ